MCYFLYILKENRYTDYIVICIVMEQCNITYDSATLFFYQK